MGYCHKCGESCDGEPFVLLCEGEDTGIRRTYCDRHSPQLHRPVDMIRHVQGTNATLMVEWVRGRDLLPPSTQILVQEEPERTEDDMFVEELLARGSTPTDAEQDILDREDADIGHDG